MADLQQIEDSIVSLSLLDAAQLVKKLEERLGVSAAAAAPVAFAGGAAAVGGLLYWKHHNRAKLLGCVQGNGDKLVSEKDNQTYSLSNQQNETLKPGERMELLGKKAKGDSGEPSSVETSE